MTIPQHIERKQFSDILKRFQGLNTERFRRAYDACTERGQNLLDVLPLLLHSNHPMLPGYISQNTPCSIYDYFPDGRAVHAAKSLAKSFKLQQKAHLTRDILSVFLMGSSGTVAHSGQSDFDIWVVMRDGVDPELLEELELKLSKISKWAASINMEVHFFIMFKDHFRKDINVNAEGEHCGTAQHFLLLDEFYRTAIWVAGQMPLWWLIPPESSKDYDEFAHYICQRKFIAADDFIDFGGIAELPSNEYLGAGLWHLYKALDNPYKSTMKLMLMEVYAAHAPHTVPLSQEYKEMVYAGQASLNELDAYVMVFRKIEAFFKMHLQYDRLDFLRQCFYLKVGIKLSKLKGRRNLSWRQQFLLELVDEWGWREHTLEYLDGRSNWKISTVVVERQKLVKDLNLSYRFLADFARKDQSIAKVSQQDVTRLGRKLYATFDRKAGKIERLNTGIAFDLTEHELTLIEQVSEQRTSWTLYAGAISHKDAAKYKPLKRSHFLTELLIWAHVNEVMQAESSFQLFSSRQLSLTRAELSSIRRSIAQTFNQKEADAITNFNRSSVNQRFKVYINVGRDPIAEHAGRGNQLVTDNIDSLAYGEDNCSLVLSIDIVLLNSWKEVFAYHFEGSECLSEAMAELMGLLPEEQTQLLELEVSCFGASRSEQIQKRMQNIIRQAMELKYQSPYAMYVTAVRGDILTLMYEKDEFYAITHANESRWVEYLAANREHAYQLFIDPDIRLQRPLQTMTQHHQLGQVSLFYWIQGSMASVFVFDEQGVYFHRRQKLHDLNTLLQPYGRFILAVHKRLASPGEQVRINCFEIKKQGKQFSTRPSQINLSSVQKNYFDVVVIPEGSQHDGDFTFYCDHVEFSPLEYSHGLLTAVAEHILHRRPSHEPYPAFITDLDLSAVYGKQQLSTSVYLRHKTLLEKKLNQEIDAVAQRERQ